MKLSSGHHLIYVDCESITSESFDFDSDYDMSDPDSEYNVTDSDSEYHASDLDYNSKTSDSGNSDTDVLLLLLQKSKLRSIKLF